MAFDREAAKAEGYSDDEINAYLQAEAEKKKQPTAPVVDVGEPPAPQTKIEPVGTSATSVGTTGALAVAPYVVPAAIGAGGLYGAGVAKQAFDAYREGTAAKQAHTDLQYKKMEAAANRAAGNMPAQQMRPINPAATYNVPTQNVPQMGQQFRTPPVNAGYSGPSMQANAVNELEDLFKKVPEGKVPTSTRVPGPVAPSGAMPSAGPVAPTAMPGVPAAAPAPNAPGIMAQLRALAANKILPAAGNIARGSVGPAMAMYSGELNPNEQAELERRRKMGATISR